MHKTSGKIVNPTLDGAPGSLRFLQKDINFCKELCKGLYQKSLTSIFKCKTSFVLKSNIQNIHKP